MSVFRISSRRRTRGFSLIEMLISLVIFMIVMGIIYTYLIRTKKQVTSSEQELEAADNAQAALQALREDLYLVGLGRDVDNDQPRILKCAPYDFIFVADLDQNKSNQTERYGSYNPAYPLHGTTLEWNPVWQYITTAGDWGWDPAIDYGAANNGAEVVRYSLDYNHDTWITDQDTEDFIAAMDPDLTHNQNPADFWLIKEWWGTTADATGFKNRYSGLHPVAFNIRGNLYDPNNPGMDRANYIYPNGKWPDFMFTYWGHFLDNQTTNNEPTDPNWDGEPIDLWGDWGGQPPPHHLPDGVGPDGDTNNGVLSQREIQFLLTGGTGGVDYSKVFVINPEPDVHDDFNKNGISNETRLDEFVRRIGVTIITESGVPDYERPNPEHGKYDVQPPKLYPFRDYKVSININPENLRLEGAPLLKVTPPTPTGVPVTHTPTPIIPTSTPGTPSATPVTPSVTPGTATPTPTPGAIDYNNDEIIVGGYSGFQAIALDHHYYHPSSVCQNHTARWYNVLAGADVVGLESVNFCDPVTLPDEWNDLIIAMNNSGPFENLYYYKHVPYTGIDGFELADKIRVDGGNTNTRIVAIATGNIDSEPLDSYPEIFVAYYDTAQKKSYVNYVRITGQCGSLLPPVCSPFVVNGKIVDMVMDDFDLDLVKELALIVDIQDFPPYTPQLIVLNNLVECYTGNWDIMFQAAQVYPVSSGEMPVALDYGTILDPDLPTSELVIVSNQGNLVIVPNNGFPNFFETTLCFPPLIAYPVVSDLEVYSIIDPDPTEVYDRFAVITKDYLNTLLNYKSTGNCMEISLMSGVGGCSGPLTTYPTQIYPYDILNVPISRTLFGEYQYNVLVILLYNVDFGLHQLALVADPCQALYPDDVCFIDLSILPYRHLTSTRNMRTPIYESPADQAKPGGRSLMNTGTYPPSFQSGPVFQGIQSQNTGKRAVRR
ncbi:prepilin-type N-terminal cleavage/methylation domain-containing protein [bacterium]|nr:prepilin-type N-terminal cleavage/methylation domain-containing protein [candidate division CSSED10-310 bacterium]